MTTVWSKPGSNIEVLQKGAPTFWDRGRWTPKVLATGNRNKKENEVGRVFMFRRTRRLRMRSILGDTGGYSCATEVCFETNGLIGCFLGLILFWVSFCFLDRRATGPLSVNPKERNNCRSVSLLKKSKFRDDPPHKYGSINSSVSGSGSQCT